MTIHPVLSWIRGNPSAKKALIGSAVIGSIVFASCVSTDRVVMLPPAIAGAQFVGSGECALCHWDVTENFTMATHANLTITNESGVVDVGCESCHGPGSLHVESGGELAMSIHNPGRSSEACFECHSDLRGRFHLASAHPVMGGQMTCTDCHDPHAGPAVMGGGTALHGENATCLECHSAQAGPFAFEHEAMRDGCAACHEVHGSVNPKLLKSRTSNLCLQCHMVEPAGTNASGGPVIMIGGRDHSAFLSRGTCWVAGCHEAVHGSHASSSLRF